MTIEEAIDKYIESEKINMELAENSVSAMAKSHNLDNAEKCRQMVEWLRELAERRKMPEIICCGECGHSMYDEDGELYCDNPNTDIYYTRYDFACNRSERRTDDCNKK